MRTKGSNSLNSISFKALVRHIEGDAIAEQVRYEGFIDISRVWIEKYFNPSCEMVLVDRRDIRNPFALVRPDAKVIEMEKKETIVSPTRDCVPREFELTDDDLQG